MNVSDGCREYAAVACTCVVCRCSGVPVRTGVGVWRLAALLVPSRGVTIG